jgi:TPR repeat protein
MATALALAAVGTAAAQDAGRSNLVSAEAAYDRGDYAEAVRLWRIAADQGHASAQTNLGIMYANGRGVPKNDTEAVRWYRMAADQGNANAQTILGTMYELGLGVPQNYAEAVRWYRMAADQDLEAAQSILGLMYKDGQGVPQDSVEAYKWLQLSAHQGQSSNYDLIESLLDWMSPDEIAEGERLITSWYRIAAGRGYARAQDIVGGYYYSGEGVPQNYVEAIRWYRLSADQGYQPAQNTLGNMYYFGRGVPQNDVEAYKWYALSVAQGDNLAAYTNSVAGLDRVRSRMTPAQIAEGQRLVAAWRPS